MMNLFADYQADTGEVYASYFEDVLKQLEAGLEPLGMFPLQFVHTAVRNMNKLNDYTRRWVYGGGEVMTHLKDFRPPHPGRKVKHIQLEIPEKFRLLGFRLLKTEKLTFETAAARLNKKLTKHETTYDFWTDSDVAIAATVMIGVIETASHGEAVPKFLNLQRNKRRFAPL